MRSPAEGLEPADVNPAQLRKTAFILVALILVGAVAITASYFQTASEQQKEFRPAFVDELIKGQMQFQLSDGEVVDTSQIEEDVWLLYQTSFEGRENHPEREKALALLPNEGVRQIEFFVDIDPNLEADRVRLATLPEEEGVWKVAAKHKVLEKYLKSELRFGTIPHHKGGKLIYDPSVAVLKRDRTKKNPRIHIRGELFDFKRAAMEAEKRKTPEAAEGYRKDWFLRTITYLLNEGDPTKNQ